MFTRGSNWFGLERCMFRLIDVGLFSKDAALTDAANSDATDASE